MKIAFLTPVSKEVITGVGARWGGKNVTGEVLMPKDFVQAANYIRDVADVSIIDSIAEHSTSKDVAKRLKGTDLAVIQLDTFTYDISSKTAKLAKNVGCKVCMVGVHATALSIETLKEMPYVDFIIRKEYEIPLRQIAEGKKISQIGNITYRDGKRIKSNPDLPFIKDLDILGIPSYDLINFDLYNESVFRKKCATIRSGRGCPNSCTFCIDNVIHGRCFRFKSAKMVADELEYLQSKGIKEIYFDDTTFEISKKRVYELCEEIKNRHIDLDWSPQCRVDCVDRNLLKAMYAAGCYRIKFGVESGNNEILRNIKKGFTVEQIEKSFKLTSEIGIQNHATAVIGLPGETKQTIENTLQFLFKLNPEYVQFSIATPFPGTEFFNYVKKMGYLKFESWNDFQGTNKAVISYPNLSATDIVNSMKYAYRSYYTRPAYLFKQMRWAFRSRDEFMHKMKLAKSFAERLSHNQL